MEALLNKTFTQVINKDDQELHFITAEGLDMYFYHDQNCCESVNIVDITGDLSDLIDTPILSAEEAQSFDAIGDEPDWYDSTIEWTFYTFRTIKGSVTVRWFGSSNGYYSTSVSFNPGTN